MIEQMNEGAHCTSYLKIIWCPKLLSQSDWVKNRIPLPPYLYPHFNRPAPLIQSAPASSMPSIITPLLTFHFLRSPHLPARTYATNTIYPSRRLRLLPITVTAPKTKTVYDNLHFRPQIQNDQDSVAFAKRVSGGIGKETKRAGESSRSRGFFRDLRNEKTPPVETVASL